MSVISVFLFLPTVFMMLTMSLPPIGRALAASRSCNVTS